MMNAYIISIIISIIAFFIFSYMDKKNGAVFTRGRCLAILLMVVIPVLNIAFCLLGLFIIIRNSGVADKIAAWLDKEI